MLKLEFTNDEMEEMLTFANAAASIITTRKGALRVMPYKEEVGNYTRIPNIWLRK